MECLTRLSLAAVVLAAIATPAAGGEIEGREAEISNTIELEQQHATAACKAQLELTWYQAGDSVHVESLLTNGDCDASSGSYSIEVRYRNADGELIKVAFPETWSRDDAAGISAENDYYLAENIDVVRVRSRKLRCKCAATEPAP